MALPKKLTALAQPIMDIIATVPPSFLSDAKLAPGSYGLVSSAAQNKLLSKIDKEKISLSIGGSATNSVIAAATLGTSTNLMGLIGPDEFGQTLTELLAQLSVSLTPARSPSGFTGTCLSLVTPDGERTMRTHLGVATSLTKEDLCKDTIAHSDWLLIEGYLFTASEANCSAACEAIAIAKAHNTNIALSASAEFVVQKKKQFLLSEILPNIDLLFANETEALALTDSASVELALQDLHQFNFDTLITCGAKGAQGYFNGQKWSIPAAPTNKPILDTTGAGDVFAGAFLAAIIQDKAPEKAVKLAAHMASLVITQRGATLPVDAINLWK